MKSRDTCFSLCPAMIAKNPFIRANSESARIHSDIGHIDTPMQNLPEKNRDSTQPDLNQDYSDPTQLSSQVG